MVEWENGRYSLDLKDAMPLPSTSSRTLPVEGK